MSRKIDMVGKRVGCWSVIKEAGKTSRGKITFLCKCDCGNTSEIVGTSLRSGDSSSCHSCANSKHKMTGSPEYMTWARMRRRCNNKKDKDYNYYGGRGIRVCSRWEESFDNFYSDMGNKPTPKHSIDRINNNGNYTPDNCRWATQEQQNQNRRKK